MHQQVSCAVNQTVPRLAPCPRLQEKLRIGSLDDPLEDEADRVADQVMRVPDPASSSAAKMQGNDPVRPGDSGLVQKENQRKFCREQPSAEPAILFGFETGIPTCGASLSARERAYFEPRFGRDFSNVRIHEDSMAGRAAESISARAFTLRQHIAFAPGQYRPGTPDGRRLLAHELVHVAQQSAAPHYSLDTTRGTPNQLHISADNQPTIRRWASPDCIEFHRRAFGSTSNINHKIYTWYALQHIAAHGINTSWEEFGFASHRHATAADMLFYFPDAAEIQAYEIKPSTQSGVSQMNRYASVGEQLCLGPGPGGEPRHTTWLAGDWIRTPVLLPTENLQGNPRMYVWVTPRAPGEIVHHQLPPEEVTAAMNAWLPASSDLDRWRLHSRIAESGPIPSAVGSARTPNPLGPRLGGFEANLGTVPSSLIWSTIVAGRLPSTIDTGIPQPSQSRSPPGERGAPRVFQGYPIAGRGAEESGVRGDATLDSIPTGPGAWRPSEREREIGRMARAFAAAGLAGGVAIALSGLAVEAAPAVAAATGGMALVQALETIVSRLLLQEALALIALTTMPRNRAIRGIMDIVQGSGNTPDA